MNPISKVKLIPVTLESGFELGVHPKIAELFDLKPGKKIDSRKSDYGPRGLLPKAWFDYSHSSQGERMWEA